MNKLILILSVLALTGCSELTPTTTTGCSELNSMRTNGVNRASGDTAYVFKFNQSTDRVVIGFFDDWSTVIYDPSNVSTTIRDGSWSISNDCVITVEDGSNQYIISNIVLGDYPTQTVGIENAIVSADFERISPYTSTTMTKDANTLSFDESPAY